jgi:hypothetical protein
LLQVQLEEGFRFPRLDFGFETNPEKVQATTQKEAEVPEENSTETTETLAENSTENAGTSVDNSREEAVVEKRTVHDSSPEDDKTDTGTSSDCDSGVVMSESDNCLAAVLSPSSALSALSESSSGINQLQLPNQVSSAKSCSVADSPRRDASPFITPPTSRATSPAPSDDDSLYEDAEEIPENTPESSSSAVQSGALVTEKLSGKKLQPLVTEPSMANNSQAFSSEMSTSDNICLPPSSSSSPLYIAATSDVCSQPLPSHSDHHSQPLPNGSNQAHGLDNHISPEPSQNPATTDATCDQDIYKDRSICDNDGSSSAMSRDLTAATSKLNLDSKDQANHVDEPEVQKCDLEILQNCNNATSLTQGDNSTKLNNSKLILAQYDSTKVGNSCQPQSCQATPNHDEPQTCQTSDHLEAGEHHSQGNGDSTECEKQHEPSPANENVQANEHGSEDSSESEDESETDRNARQEKEKVLIEDCDDFLDVTGTNKKEEENLTGRNHTINFPSDPEIASFVNPKDEVKLTFDFGSKGTSRPADLDPNWSRASTGMSTTEWGTGEDLTTFEVNGAGLSEEWGGDDGDDTLSAAADGSEKKEKQDKDGSQSKWSTSEKGGKVLAETDKELLDCKVKAENLRDSLSNEDEDQPKDKETVKDDCERQNDRDEKDDDDDESGWGSEASRDPSEWESLLHGPSQSARIPWSDSVDADSDAANCHGSSKTVDCEDVSGKKLVKDGETTGTDSSGGKTVIENSVEPDSVEKIAEMKNSRILSHANKTVDMITTTTTTTSTTCISHPTTTTTTTMVTSQTTNTSPTVLNSTTTITTTACHTTTTTTTTTTTNTKDSFDIGSWNVPHGHEKKEEREGGGGCSEEESKEEESTLPLISLDHDTDLETFVGPSPCLLLQVRAFFHFLCY